MRSRGRHEKKTQSHPSASPEVETGPPPASLFVLGQLACLSPFRRSSEAESFDFSAQYLLVHQLLVKADSELKYLKHRLSLPLLAHA